MLMRSLVLQTVPIAFGAIANRTRSSTPSSFFHYRAPPPQRLSSLRAPPRSSSRRCGRIPSLDGEAAPGTSNLPCLALPRLVSSRCASHRLAPTQLDSTRLDSPQLDSTRLDSTQLDSLRFVSFRLARLVSFALPRLLREPRDPKDCNSCLLSSDSSALGKSRVISKLTSIALLIKSYRGTPIYLDCFRIVNLNSLDQFDFSFKRWIVVRKHCLPTFYVVCSNVKHRFHWSKTLTLEINWEIQML